MIDSITSFISRCLKLLKLISPNLSSSVIAKGCARFPIDAVITWVDGSDPTFIAQRARFKPSANGVGSATARYESRGEINFVIISLLRYMPWLRRIYLVTAFGQKPLFAQMFPEKVTVVDHREILSQNVLPTFNSHAISVCIAAIPGLSERFLYVNDDTFIGRPVAVSDMVNKHGQIYLRHDFARPPQVASQHPYLGSIANSEACLYQRFPDRISVG